MGLIDWVKSLSVRQAPTIAVSAHLYYPDVSLEILAYLARIRQPFTLFVSHSAPISAAVLEAIERLDRPFRLVKVDNKGRDLSGFIETLKHPDMAGHEYVLKLHTKRGSSDIGDTWRNYFLTSLVGDGSQFDAILAAFAIHRKLMLVGPADTYISATQFMYANQRNVDQLQQSLLGGFGLPEWGFFAGTMFFGRVKVFDPIRTSRIAFEDGGAEDGRVEHALERICGLLPAFRGGEIGLVRGRAVDILRGIGVPSKTAITSAMRKLQAAGVH